MKNKECFIDVHCHIDRYENIDEIVENAEKNDVKIMVAQGVTQETNEKALELAKNFKSVKAALGLYPIEAIKLDEKEIDNIIEFIRKNKKSVSAIGEVGIDFKEDLENHEYQKKIFDKLVKLSIELDVPIIIHSRKAEIECIDILEKNNAKKVIMHCFSGKFSLVKRIIENKWSLSIPTSVKNSEHFQKIIGEHPIEQLLCETDSPYLHPDKKWPNEPANVIASYEKIAEIKKLSIEKVKKQIFENYSRLFSK
ncbi:MAG: TatD family hydrolase [archaeon]